MKNQDQANKNTSLNDPAIVNDPQPLVEDLPISGEQEERVKGGATTASFNPGVLAVAGNASPQKDQVHRETIEISSWSLGS